MELTKEDYKIIEEIVKTTEIIDNLYNKLYELEQNNQKNITEYSKNIDYLKMTIEELEDKQYNSLNIDLSKGFTIIAYLSDNLLHPLVQTNYILNQFNTDNRIFERITTTILSNSMKNLSDVKKIIKQNLNMFPNDSSEISNIIENGLNNGSQINSSIDKDYKKLILILLDNEIQKDETLLKFKYNFIFVNKDIERELLNNKLNINDNLARNLSITSIFLGMDDTTTSIVNDFKLTELFIAQVDYLLNIDDIDYLNNNKLTSIIMRSLLSLMSEEQIYECNYNFYELIESKKYKDKHTNNRNREDLIISVFKKIKNDRAKVKTLCTKKDVI